MHKASILIVDDERLSRKRMRRLLAVEEDLEVIGECANGQEAITAINQRRPDVLFLDIQMPQMDGFEVLQAVSFARVPIVIFVTAYDEYAVRAFDVHAFDYLLKPFDRKRFQETIQRARAQLQQLQNGDLNQRLFALLESLNGRRRMADRIAVKTGGHVVFVKTQNIDWIEAADNYVCLHCGAETHALRETMNSLEGRLDNSRFLRIHRSTIVNVDRIKELQPWFRGDYLVLLHDGTQLTLSRNYRERLKTALLKSF
jgi:two-component system, LytTR family, response regulator